MAAVTIGIERGLLFDRAVEASPVRTVRLETACGVLSTRARVSPHGRVEAVAVTLPCTLVVAAGHVIAVGGRVVRADVAWCGGFYAIVDAESAGLALNVAALPELRRAGIQIAETLSSSPVLWHPEQGIGTGLDGVVFTGQPRAEDAHLSSVTVCADGSMDRSPCGGATAAVMAVLEAMGLMRDDASFVHESLIGTRFTARIVGRAEVGELPAIIPEIEGTAWITGEHTFYFDEGDPLREGFRL
jgi:proline racemase